MLKKIISMSLISATLLSVTPATAAWRQDNNKNYMYTDSNGQNITGWKFIDTDWYYFNGNGVMKTGWIFDNGSWYYLWSTGQMATNSWVTTCGITYYFGEDGKLVSSSVTKNYYKYSLEIPGTIVSEQVNK